MNDYMKLLGMKAKDRVTGASGVVTSLSFDLYGCVQAWLTPPVAKGGKQPDNGGWYDAKRLEVTAAKPVMEQPVFAAPGTERGPERKASPHSGPGRI